MDRYTRSPSGEHSGERDKYHTVKEWSHFAGSLALRMNLGTLRECHIVVVSSAWFFVVFSKLQTLLPWEGCADHCRNKETEAHRAYRGISIVWFEPHVSIHIPKCVTDVLLRNLQWHILRSCRNCTRVKC